MRASEDNKDNFRESKKKQTKDRKKARKNKTILG